MGQPSFSTEKIKPPRRLLNARQAAARAGYSESRFRVLARAGVLPAPIRLGLRKVMWDSDKLDRYIAERAAFFDNGGVQ
ncbi:helix-turn-helix transcriptional regulator [Xanthobacter sp. TB0139]|uniref:helix-turn-helix transcriptional regulator n=1 Tax=Xanthobacter sp. TB0139 TaxID=3459178 RepID=UPI0040399AC3